MFVTVEGSELFVPEYLRDEGHRYWPFVCRPTVTQWLHVEFKVLEPDSDSSSEQRTLLAMHPEQLLDVASQPKVKFVSLNLVLPPRMSTSSLWTMEQINEVWVGQAPADPNTPAWWCHVFIGSDGKEHIWGGFPMRLAQLTKARKMLDLTEKGMCSDIAH